MTIPEAQILEAVWWITTKDKLRASPKEVAARTGFSLACVYSWLGALEAMGAVRRSARSWASTEITDYGCRILANE